MKSYYLSVIFSGLTLLALSYCHLYGQTNDSAVPLSARSEQYKEHVGKINFTEVAVQKGQTESVNFLSRYVFTNRSNLFIAVSLEKSLTEFLGLLAPNLPTDPLAKTGNYQFSFYIDDRLVYLTELLPGAPTPLQQREKTF